MIILENKNIEYNFIECIKRISRNANTPVYLKFPLTANRNQPSDYFVSERVTMFLTALDRYSFCAVHYFFGGPRVLLPTKGAPLTHLNVFLRDARSIETRILSQAELARQLDLYTYKVYRKVSPFELQCVNTTVNLKKYIYIIYIRLLIMSQL